MKYARHHEDGVNFALWRYCLLLAARHYHARNLGEAARYLARALHYAQDGVVAKYIMVTGVLGEFSELVDELRNVVEGYLDADRDILGDKLTGVYKMYLELPGESHLDSRKSRRKSK